MNCFRALLQRPPVLLEGAMGTLLMTRGLPAGQPGEVFTFDNPAAVSEVHRAYAQAGAQVHLTNTFNGNRCRLAHAGLADRVAECNRRAVELARQEADGTRAVVGSIGPTGQLLAPLGPLAPDEARDVFREQAEALVGAGVDALLIETMIDVQEALVALTACRQVTDVPVIVSLSYSATSRGFYTVMGNALADVLRRLADAGADVVGANCQLSSTAMIPLAEETKRATDLPILIKPNAGLPQAKGDIVLFAEDAETYAKNVARYAAIGVEVIGGCCGTTPDFIAAARKRLDARAA